MGATVSDDAVMYTILEVAKLTGLSRSTLYREMGCKKLDYVMIRRCRRIPKSSLDLYVQTVLRDTRRRAAGVSP
jgi:excisionase family DNA binding protein